MMMSVGVGRCQLGVELEVRSVPRSRPDSVSGDRLAAKFRSRNRRLSVEVAGVVPVVRRKAAVHGLPTLRGGETL
jgi:hypothetical protein